MKGLAIITARGGSKGVPGKNIKLLNGKPLINYSIDHARLLFDDQNICLSTDDESIKEVAQEHHLEVPFLRPKHLSRDDSRSYKVIQHAIEFYESKGRKYDYILLLQPTSPFRTKKQLEEATSLYSNDIDMVMSVHITDSNPYRVLYEENKIGIIEKSKKGLNITRRQDEPKVYKANGSIYIINVESIKKYQDFNDYKKIKKYVMPKVYSSDIDDIIDWYFCEMLIEKGLIN